MDRDLSFEGVHNFRDVGGYETAAGAGIAWRRLLRSGALADLAEVEAGRLHDSLQLRTVIDLRHPETVLETGAGPIDALGVRRLNLSIFDPLQTFASYRDRTIAAYGSLNSPEALFGFLEEGAPAFRELFQTLADESAYPVLLHCTAGKDRTGVAIGLVLDLLGVSEEVIVADFALSDRDADRLFAAFRPTERWADRSDDELREFVHTHPESMVDFLARLRGAHGSAREYLLGIGVDEATLDRVVANLTEA